MNARWLRSGRRRGAARRWLRASAGWRRGLLLVCLWGGATLLLPPQTGMAQVRSNATAAISGTVVNAAGEGVGGAVVTLRCGDKTRAETRTDAAGRFAFAEAAPPTACTVRAGKASAGEGSVAVEPAQAGSALRVVLRPAADASGAAAQGGSGVGQGAGKGAPGQEIAFSDQPNFTVAGVTDWTAAGGHGSDVTLRASEELARETTGRGAAATTPSREAAAGASAADARNAAAGTNAAEESRLRAAVAAQPRSYGANHALGMLALQTGRYAEAEGPLKTASDLSGHAGGDEYLLAETCEGLADHAEALRHVEQALAREDRAEYHALAGEVAEQLHDPLRAVAEMQRAVKLDPSESNYFAWGSELLLHRAVAEAGEVFSAGAKQYPTSVRLRSGWGAALYGSGRYDEAAAELCAASDLQPEEREPYVTMGKADVASPRELGCVGERLMRFLRLRPQDADANYYAAMDLLKRGAEADRERATVLLQEAARLDPQSAPASLQLGVVAANRRDFPEAIAWYRKAIAADPHLAEAHYRLGLALERTGKQDEGRAELARRDELARAQAAAVEQQRREIKQFVVDTRGSGGDARP